MAIFCIECDKEIDIENEELYFCDECNEVMCEKCFDIDSVCSECLGLLDNLKN